MLRGVAVGLVLLRHAWPAEFPGAGIVGVTVFFALSGYLITGVLDRDVRRNGRVSYGAFYRNRAVRLLPALLLFLVGLAAVTLALDPLGQVDRLLPTVLIALTYTADLPLGVAMHPGTSHLWTLAVEEQFYLVWPLVMLFGLRRGRLPQLIGVTIAGLIAVATLASLVFRAHLSGLYHLPVNWASALAIGAAAYVARDRLFEWTAGRAGAIGAVIATVGLAGFCFMPDAKDEPLTYIVGAPLIALCTVWLIGYVSRWASLPTPALAPLRALGTISYATYLWNFLIVAWITGRDGTITGWQAASTVPLTIAAATVSWWLIEKRANENWKAPTPPVVVTSTDRAGALPS